MSNITYDKNGRLQYNPEIHGKHGTPWLAADEKYLIDNYELDGPEQVSLALERTTSVIMKRACKLRKLGLIGKPKTKKYHQRIHMKNKIESKGGST